MADAAWVITTISEPSRTTPAANSNGFKKVFIGNSLAVQWLRLCGPNAGGPGSIPGRGTKILHAARRGQKKKKKGLYTFITHECTKKDCPRGGYLDATARDHTGLDRIFLSKAVCKLCFK